MAMLITFWYWAQRSKNMETIQNNGVTHNERRHERSVNTNLLTLRKVPRYSRASSVDIFDICSSDTDPSCELSHTCRLSKNSARKRYNTRNIKRKKHEITSKRQSMRCSERFRGGGLTTVYFSCKQCPQHCKLLIAREESKDAGNFNLKLNLLQRKIIKNPFHMYFQLISKADNTPIDSSYSVILV